MWNQTSLNFFFSFSQLTWTHVDVFGSDLTWTLSARSYLQHLFEVLCDE